MKFAPIFLVFLLPCIVKCQSPPSGDLDPEDSLDEDSFEEFFHLENITDPVEHKKREDALSENEAIIKEENDEYLAGNKTWYDKVNEFSDLPADEFKDEKTGDIKPAEFGRGLLEPALDSPGRVDAASERYFADFRNSMRTNRGNIPSTYSSVAYGYVSPVRNQKQCGSCVAFANMAIVETCFLKLGAAGDYSEQQFVDCGYNQNNANGCNGASSYSYVKTFADSKMSLTAEATYPYKNIQPALECPASIKSYNKGASISGSAYTYQGDEDTMEGLVYYHGAVTTAIATSGPGFMDYSGGIFAGCTNEQTDHAVTVVGYGVDTNSGMKYWLVKNSWGTGWGQDGYFKMQRGVGMCGIGGVMVTVQCQAVAGPTDATLVAEEPCEDKYSDCGDYKNYCNHDNIQSGCPSTCGLCPGQTPDASTTCFDDFGNCPSLAEETCYYYADKCQKSCGMCKGMTPAASNTCYNVYSNCPDLCGSIYEGYCKKACGKC